MGLRLGALGLKTMFVRIPAEPGSRAVVASRGHFPSTLDAAVRQKARWIGGIAFAGWDRLGWRGGLGERWMRMRDRRGPLAALLLLAGYARRLAVGQVALAAALGAPIAVPVSPALATLLWINAWLLGWRVADARRLHRLGLRLARRAALDPADGRRQCHRHPRRPPRAAAPLGRRRQALGQDPPHLSRGDAAHERIRSASWALRWSPGRRPRRQPGPGPGHAGAGVRRRRQPGRQRPPLPPIQPTALPPIEPVAPNVRRCSPGPMRR